MEQIKHSPASVRHVCLVLPGVFREAWTMNCWGYVKCGGYMGLSTGKHLGMLSFFFLSAQNPCDIEYDMHSEAFLS